MLVVFSAGVWYTSVKVCVGGMPRRPADVCEVLFGLFSLMQRGLRAHMENGLYDWQMSLAALKQPVILFSH